MTDVNESAGALDDPVRVLRIAGWVAMGAGLLLAVIQANSGSRDSGLWIVIFIGVAIVGALLRIEAAVRDAKRH